MNIVLCNATPADMNQGKDKLDANKTTIALDSCCSNTNAKRREEFIGPMKHVT